MLLQRFFVLGLFILCAFGMCFGQSVKDFDNLSYLGSQKKLNQMLSENKISKAQYDQLKKELADKFLNREANEKEKKQSLAEQAEEKKRLTPEAKLKEATRLAEEYRVKSEQLEKLPKANISFQAGIVYTMGGFQPVVGETFVLLEPISNGDAIFLEQFEKVKYMFDCPVTPISSKMNMIGPLSQLVLSAHRVIGKIETDVEGKASYNQIRAGQYKIFGGTATRSGAALWYYDVELTGQDVNLLLDSKKTLLIF